MSVTQRHPVASGGTTPSRLRPPSVLQRIRAALPPVAQPQSRREPHGAARSRTEPQRHPGESVFLPASADTQREEEEEEEALQQTCRACSSSSH
ncbi:hypothetical protein EYF80_067593 [Liparis tanakae]|uniref:Uncharacterized protein n=1 Tax=Liparis tanakae TaxID=230148 RepID=A0A4Z2E0J4_9TELE|nr:hypothetical protein EYF80_067593 [Liparis tanakae]